MNKRAKPTRFGWLVPIAAASLALLALDRIRDLGPLPYLVAGVSVAFVLVAARKHAARPLGIALLIGAAGLVTLELLDAGVLPSLHI